MKPESEGKTDHDQIPKPMKRKQSSPTTFGIVVGVLAWGFYKGAFVIPIHLVNASLELVFLLVAGFAAIITCLSYFINLFAKWILYGETVYAFLAGCSSAFTLCVIVFSLVTQRLPF